METEGENPVSEMECPYCGQYGPINDTTTVAPAHRMRELENRHGVVIGAMYYYACPNPRCRELTVTASLDIAKYQTDVPSGSVAWLTSGNNILTRRLLPSSRAKAFPEYVPQQIRDDYTESCAIEVSSPKA